jgi:hypothetical protein
MCAVMGINVKPFKAMIVQIVASGIVIKLDTKVSEESAASVFRV